MSLPARHDAFVSSARAFGAKRYQALCSREDCPWRGELRREAEAAEEDARAHEGSPDMIPPLEGPAR